MAALYEPYDPARPSRRDAFPYRVEMRIRPDPHRFVLMVRWLGTAMAEGNYTVYRVRGDHIERGHYESRVFAFDHSSTAFQFGERFEEDRW